MPDHIKKWALEYGVALSAPSCWFFAMSEVSRIPAQAGTACRKNYKREQHSGHVYKKMRRNHVGGKVTCCSCVSISIPSLARNHVAMPTSAVSVVSYVVVVVVVVSHFQHIMRTIYSYCTAAADPACGLLNKESNTWGTPTNSQPKSSPTRKCWWRSYPHKQEGINKKQNRNKRQTGSSYRYTRWPYQSHPYRVPSLFNLT